MSRKQLSAVLQFAEQSGSLDTLNEGQLRRVLDFSETTVSQVMVTPDELIAFEKRTPMKTIINQVLKNGHRRFQVYDKVKSNITGIALVSNWAMLDRNFADFPLEKLTTPAMHIGAGQYLDGILPALLDRKDRMAIVIDKNENAIGMVTFEDLISSAIGDINFIK